jgi:DNA-directed RNA polymerase subunit alpha
MTLISVIQSKINKDYSHFGTFLIEPLNIGQGVTLGNTLRRTLLLDLSSFGITAIRINKLKHEFTVISDIREDILEIILNLKQIIFKESFFNLKVKKNKFFTLYLKNIGPKIITASMLNLPKNLIIILNPNQYICTISKKFNLYIEIDIEKNNGYMFHNNEKNIQFNNLNISVDSNFIPIKNVNFKIKIIYDTFGHIKESLFLEILTNGSITPYRSLQESFKILLNLFSLPLISLNSLTNKNN